MLTLEWQVLTVGRVREKSCYVWATASCLMLLGCAAERITGVVPVDWPIGVTAPVAVPLPAFASTADVTGIRMDIAGQDRPVVLPVQCEAADPVAGTPARAWCLFSASEGNLGKPVTVRFGRRGTGLLGVTQNLPGPAYRVSYDAPMLHVTRTDGQPVLSYWHGSADGNNPKGYPLNDFIHPLIGLDGEVLTASSPPDHVHHRGVFWAWVRNELRGQSVGDWWMPHDIHAEPGSLAHATGPVMARFVAQHFWAHQPEGAPIGERFVDEQVVCRIFATGATGRAMDIDLTLTALDDGVRIGGQLAKDAGYSGMTIRFGQAGDVLIECDDGPITDASVNHLRARWVDWTGMFAGPDGKAIPHRSGGGLLVHPTHPDLPPEWITRRYGPINVSYPGLNMLDIPKDRPLRLRYRLWLHRGDASEGQVDKQYRAYAADWKWH